MNYEIKKNDVVYIFDNEDINILEDKIKVYRFNILCKKGSYHTVKLNKTHNKKNKAYFDSSIHYNFRIRNEYISFIVNEYKGK